MPVNVFQARAGALDWLLTPAYKKKNEKTYIPMGTLAGSKKQETKDNTPKTS